MELEKHLSDRSPSDRAHLRQAGQVLMLQPGCYATGCMMQPLPDLQDEGMARETEGGSINWLASESSASLFRRSRP
jgi:hypothetical protein